MEKAPDAEVLREAIGFAAERRREMEVADQLRPKPPKLAAPLDEAEIDVLAFLNFAKERWDKIRSTNPTERVNGQIKRRTDVIGIFPSEAAVLRLVAAILREPHNAWAVPRSREMTRAGIAAASDNPIGVSPAAATWRPGKTGSRRGAKS